MGVNRNADPEQLDTCQARHRLVRCEHSIQQRKDREGMEPQIRCQQGMRPNEGEVGEWGEVGRQEREEERRLLEQVGCEKEGGAQRQLVGECDSGQRRAVVMERGLAFTCKCPKPRAGGRTKPW